MANSSVCAGCLNKLNDAKFMTCSRCKAKYHNSCLNFTTENYNAMSNELKSKWVCSLCYSKDRLGGDNTNTPVRATPSPQQDYVTQRTKARSVPNCSCLSASNIRDIIREELQLSFKQLIHPQLLEVRNAVTSLEESMSRLTEDLNNIKAEQIAQVTEIRNIKLENESLRATNQSLSSRLSQLDQHLRSSNIEIQCIPENKQENLISTVQQLGKIIKCPINETNIHYCSRVAKMNSGSPRPRSILVKFSSPRLRDEFLAATSKFNKTNKDDKLNTSHLGIGGQKKIAIYVTEHLSPENKSLHAAARSKAKELKYKFVWVRDGKIYMRKDEESNYVYVKNIDLLNRLS